MEQKFKGKVVLITGGSRGIGRACAQLFAAQGARVIITYKSNREEADHTLELMGDGQQHIALQLDSSQPGSIESLFNVVLEKYNRLDVLVNNAGIFKEHKIDSIYFDGWQQAWKETIDTNLIGVANMCYFAARQMIQQQYGKIINISSRGAFRGEPDHTAYGASKAGLNSLTQSLAVALGKHNIVVGAVAPGFVQTDMVADFLDSEVGEMVKAQSPFNRVATPEEVARVVAMFASDGVEFMTGGIVDVNGASYLRT